MGRLAQTEGLTDVQQEIVKTVRGFVDKEILPHVAALEREDTYPTEIVEGMKEMGLFGLMIPEEHGGLGESLLTYALVVEEIARGWMSVSGIINTHFIVAYLLQQHGTDEQRKSLLPRMATGEVRGSFSMSEPALGSDVSAITTRAVRDGDDYLITGQKMWITNGGTSNLLAVLVRTDAEAAPDAKAAPADDDVPGREGAGLRRGRARAHHPREDREDGLQGGRLDRGGLRQAPGAGHRRPGRRAEQGLLPDDGRRRGGPRQRGRRGCGVAQRAFELGIRYAQQRETFGKPIAQHQAVQFRLAEMATKVEAGPRDDGDGRQEEGLRRAQRHRGGMAKYLASEYCKEVVEDSFRIHGGYGYSKEYEIERLYREAPMLLIGEGTSDIQKMIIGRRLLEEYKLRG
jgi:alkylation response protein AidB-like acyl-CoA dehydrogenase